MTQWGGDEPLQGVVDKVEPWGFTKFSALGVEEQRVNEIIKFVGDPDVYKRLGHGFRAEVKIVIWENEAALKAPSSAMFRIGNDWAAFKVENGCARLTKLTLGKDNGFESEIIDGLKEGERIVLYPGNQVTDGRRIKERVLSN